MLNQKERLSGIVAGMIIEEDEPGRISALTIKDPLDWLYQIGIMINDYSTIEECRQAFSNGDMSLCNISYDIAYPDIHAFFQGLMTGMATQAAEDVVVKPNFQGGVYDSMSLRQKNKLAEIIDEELAICVEHSFQLDYHGCLSIKTKPAY